MLFAVLAVGSKETGLLAAPLLVVLAFVEGEGSPARRWRDALRVAAPALIALAVVLLLRLWVLGGLGGHGGSSLVAGALRAPLVAWLFVPALLVPQPLGAETLGLALALALAAALVLLRRFDRRVDGACLVSGAWLVGLLLLSGISGDLAPWYAASLLPAYGLLYGALVAGALAAWRGGARPLALASLLVALLAAASPLRHSGLFQRYPQWQRVSTATTAFLSDLGQRIRAPEAGGAVLRVSGLPDREPHTGAVGLHGSAAGLAPYSVQAWADATLHPRRVRIVTEAPTRIDPDEIVVLLHRP
jgi:hypothetical protein